MGLDEPYRLTIVHRYFDDLSPPEIAARLGVPLQTVRTRLKRALAQLRVRLEEPFGRDRGAMLLALAPVAAMSWRPASRTALALGGGALVKAKVILVLGVVLLGAAVYLVSWHRVQEPSRTAGSPHVAAAPPLGKAEAGEVPQASPPDSPVSADFAPRLLVGGIVHAEAKDALIEIRPETTRETPGDVIARATVPTEEPFEIPALDPQDPPLALFVRARCSGHVPAEARTVVLLDARTREPRVPPVELTLARAATLHGQVVDPDGAPSPEATVAAFTARRGSLEETAVDVTDCDAQGRFELLVGTDGKYAVVAMSPGTRPGSLMAEARLGDVTELPPMQLGGGEKVAGRVTVTGGAPARRAKVRAVLRAQGSSRLRIPRRDMAIAWCDGRAEWRFVDGVADDDGRYEIRGLRPGSYQVVLLGVEGGHPGLTQGGGALDALKLLSGERDELDDHAWIRSELKRDVRPSTEGVDFEVAIATVEIVVAPSMGRPREARFEIAAVTGVLSIQDDYPVGETLSKELIVTPGGQLRIRALAEGYEPRTVEVTAPAAGLRETHRIELVPAPEKATLVMTLEPQGDGPLPALPTAFSVYLFRPGDAREDYAYRHTSLRNSEIALKDLDEGTFRLEVWPGSMSQRDQSFYRKAVTDVTLKAGETTRLSLPLAPGGRLRILVRDPEGHTNIAAGCEVIGPDGRAVEAGFAKFEGGGTSMSTGGLPGAAGPAEAMEPLAPGNYAIRVKPLDSTLGPKTVTVQIDVGRLTVAEIGLDR